MLYEVITPVAIGRKDSNISSCILFNDQTGLCCRKIFDINDGLIHTKMVMDNKKLGFVYLLKRAQK